MLNNLIVVLLPLHSNNNSNAIFSTSYIYEKPEKWQEMEQSFQTCTTTTTTTTSYNSHLCPGNFSPFFYPLIICSLSWSFEWTNKQKSFFFYFFSLTQEGTVQFSMLIRSPSPPHLIISIWIISSICSLVHQSCLKRIWEAAKEKCVGSNMTPAYLNTS